MRCTCHTACRRAPTRAGAAAAQSDAASKRFHLARAADADPSRGAARRGYCSVVAADPASSPLPYLGHGASIGAISVSLLPEDRARFHEALDAAQRDGDSPAEQVAVERWRGIALLQADPDRYAATVRRIAERKTGRPIPPDEPLSVTRRAAGL